MNQLTFVGAQRETALRMSKELGGLAEISFRGLDDPLEHLPGASMILDIDLSKDEIIPHIKQWLAKRPRPAKVICAVDRSSYLEYARACALGATDIVPRPIRAPDVISVLEGGSRRGPMGAPMTFESQAITAANAAFDGIFSAAARGEPIDLAQITAGADTLLCAVEHDGLAGWIEAVRAHHSATYQHCLLVTGLAVGFGQSIGVSRADQQRLSRAALLHDLGKAQIPLAILEKPAALNAQECAIMREHPELGFAALQTVDGLPPEILDIVLHHHEYLDGSGYPHRLLKHEISDLARMITIVDVFGALIERRAYKCPLPAAQAYKTLRDMGGKLDQDLVRAFESVAGHARP
jgi:putative nucleotidyltransferase with HDIG domain